MTTIPDWLAVLGLLVPSGTGLAGYGLAGRNDRARDERTAKREADARRASVRERLEEEGHAFQRETLLELQNVMQRQVRSVAKVILHDRRTLKESGALTQVGSELSDENYEIGVTMRRLQERVLDEQLRGSLEEFRRHVSEVEVAFITVAEMSPEDGISHLDRLQRDMVEHFLTISDQVGVALRAQMGWLPSE